MEFEQLTTEQKLDKISEISVRDWAQMILRSNAPTYLRALGTTPDAAGGFLVHPELNASLVKSAIAQGLALRMVQTSRITNGNSKTVPASLDQVVGAVKAENADTGGDPDAGAEDVVFAGSPIAVDQYEAHPFDVTVELWNDAPDVWASILFDRLARGISADIYSGTGSVQGVKSAAATYATTVADASAIAEADTAGMWAALHTDYWDSASWFAGSGIEDRLVQNAAGGSYGLVYAKNDTGRLRMQLHNMPVFSDERMDDDSTTGNAPLILAAWDRYQLRLSDPVLAINTQFGNGRIRVQAFQRAGGKLPVTESVNRAAVKLTIT